MYKDTDWETLMVKTMTYGYPDEIPVRVGTLPAVWKKQPDAMKELARRFPQFFGEKYENYKYGENLDEKYMRGATTDEWGCVWSNIEEGLASMVTGHPVKTREDVRNLVIPPNRDGSLPHGFMYLRLLDLRGFEEAMLDFAEECEELHILIGKVTEYNCIQVEARLEMENDKYEKIMSFGDDLGMQRGLAIGPEKWRKFLKPSFMKIYAIAKNAGKLIYMHTDGCIYEIIPDLAECGVNMVNPQYRANGIDNLVNVCRGKYPIMLDLDRQLFPYATPEECKDHLRECVEALYLPSGGLGLSIEIGPDVPPANIEALLEAADKCRTYK